MVADPLLIAAALAAHNLGVEHLPRWAYVPACLATAGAVVRLGGRPELGASRAAVRAGCAGAAVAVAGVGLAALAPPTRRLFHDERLAGSAAYQAFVRIPLGTVALEEVAFRGVLVDRLGPVAASVLFGAWHIVPTRTALDVNGVTEHRAAAIAAAVAATAAAGLVLCRLRRSTGSLLAPAIVHAAATASATLVAAHLTRRARARPPGSAAAPARPGSCRR